MDWHGLIGVGLMTMGGGLIGATLFKVVAGRTQPIEIGASIAISVGAILIGLTMLPGVGTHTTPLLAAGGASLISGTLLTARIRRRLPGARQDETRRLP